MICYAADFKKQLVVRQTNNGGFVVSNPMLTGLSRRKKLAGIFIFAAGVFFHTMKSTGLFPD